MLLTVWNLTLSMLQSFTNSTSDSKGTIDVLTVVNVQTHQEIRKVHSHNILIIHPSFLVSVPHLAHYLEGGRIVNLQFARLTPIAIQSESLQSSGSSPLKFLAPGQQQKGGEAQNKEPSC